MKRRMFAPVLLLALALRHRTGKGTDSRIEKVTVFSNQVKSNGVPP
ncbi:MAG: hypothetical protein R2751_16720 [Bacteroidales bacterium]